VRICCPNSTAFATGSTTTGIEEKPWISLPPSEVWKSWRSSKLRDALDLVRERKTQRHALLYGMGTPEFD
jgi:hypothetical protein